MAQHFAEPLPLGAVFKAAFLNCGEDRPRSRTAIRTQKRFDACLKRPALKDIALAELIERKTVHQKIMSPSIVAII